MYGNLPCDTQDTTCGPGKTCTKRCSGGRQSEFSPERAIFVSADLSRHHNVFLALRFGSRTSLFSVSLIMHLILKPPLCSGLPNVPHHVLEADFRGNVGTSPVGHSQGQIRLHVACEAKANRVASQCATAKGLEGKDRDALDTCKTRKKWWLRSSTPVYRAVVLQGASGQQSRLVSSGPYRRFLLRSGDSV